MASRFDTRRQVLAAFGVDVRRTPAAAALEVAEDVGDAEAIVQWRHELIGAALRRAWRVEQEARAVACGARAARLALMQAAGARVAEGGHAETPIEPDAGALEQLVAQTRERLAEAGLL